MAHVDDNTSGYIATLHSYSFEIYIHTTNPIGYAPGTISKLAVYKSQVETSAFMMDSLEQISTSAGRYVYIRACVVWSYVSEIPRQSGVQPSTA